MVWYSLMTLSADRFHLTSRRSLQVGRVDHARECLSVFCWRTAESLLDYCNSHRHRPQSTKSNKI